MSYTYSTSGLVAQNATLHMQQLHTELRYTADAAHTVRYHADLQFARSSNLAEYTPDTLLDIYYHRIPCSCNLKRKYVC